MFNSKRMISSIILGVLAVQILTSTVFNSIGSGKVEAASSDSTYQISSQPVETFAEESNESILKGDVDGNGEINSLDFARMRMYLLGMITSFPVSNGIWASDVNGDGVFNSIDFAYMRQYILGIISKFPAEVSDVTPTPSVSATPTPTDVEPPSKPTGLNYSSVTGTTVSIYWEPSIDSDVKDYVVYKNGEFEALTNGATEYTITGLLPNETYWFTVRAIDKANNKSELSDICFVTTKVSNIEELKMALIRNFYVKGTTYSLTYDGDITDIQTEVEQALLDAVYESNEPFMLKDASYSMSGYSGNLQITFTFTYDDINQYMVVARSTDELKTVLLCGLNNRTENINIIYKDTITNNDIDTAISSILNNDTYLKSCINDYSYGISSIMGIKAIRCSFNYKTTKEQEDYVDSTVEFIVSKLTNSDMTDDEKEKLIHDYILTNIDYSEEEYGDAYSALYYGKTQCEGYAMLTYKMLKAAGIENIIVTNEDHAWNVVKINGKWYHLDTTWDDAKKKDYGFYKYYNLTDDEILESRNYSNVYGKECISNYIADLSARNTENGGKYGEILKDIKQNDGYFFVNSFKSNASLNLLYNEVVLKEGESILLADDRIPAELYENSYQWSTSNPDVATVSNGIITAEKAGTVMISAQPMYDMLSTSSLFCKVSVMPVDFGDGKTVQALSQENISGFTDPSVQLQLKINSEDDINVTTTVTNAIDSLEGKTGFIGEPVNITTTSEFNWAEIGFKLSEEQLANVDIKDLLIYWYDEETGTIVPQATRVDEANGVISATVTHFSIYFVASRQVPNITTTIAFVIDSKYSSQASLNTFKTNIYNTIVELRKESNVSAVFIDAKTNEKIYNFYVPAAGVYTGSSTNTLDYVNSAFKKITPGGLTPSEREILGTVNSGMASGNEEIDSINMSGFKNNKYVLVYTRWNAYFVDNNAIIKKMGDTIGLVVGKTVGYYAGGPIAYDQTDIIPLVEFLREGNYTQVTSVNTNKTPWVLKLNGNNIENDVIVLQKMLVSLGYLKMPIDPSTNTYVPFGTYADITEAAVKKFQKNNGLTQDGKVGKATWNKLMLPWDEENAQPDRTGWSYKYILQNNNFYSANPQVTLTAPTNGTEITVGETVTISARGINCHHLAVFINGEWKVTVNGSTNTSAISINYDYRIPSTGTYSIQVKGRNVPGSSGGVLAASGTVKIEGTEPGITNADIDNAYAYFKALKEYEDRIEAIEFYGTGLPSGSYGVEVNPKRTIEAFKESMIYIQLLLLQNPVIKNNSSVSTTLINSIKDGQPVRGKQNIDSLINTLKSSNSTVNSIFNQRAKEDDWTASLVADLLPGIGDIKGVMEGITGVDVITNQPLAWWERALGFVCLSELRSAGNISDIIRGASNASDIIRAVEAAADAIDRLKYTLRYSIDELAYRIKRVVSIGDETIVDLGNGITYAIREGNDVAEAARPAYREVIQGIWKYSGKTADEIADFYLDKVASKTKVSGKFSGTPSEILRAELKDAGVTTPPYKNQAHHIVPEGDSRFPAASELREIMDDYSIDVNSASNGVFLPDAPNYPHAGNAAVHSGSHTEAYYKYVLDKMKAANVSSGNDVSAVLNSIRKELLNGTISPNM